MASPSKNITPFAETAGVDIRSPFADGESQIYSSSSNTASLLDVPRPAAFTRKMLTWRTPHLGYVQMYINPQQMTIQEKKIITPNRTKGGYVIQYAGEDLISITIRGTTGSSGMEGINVLRSIYRSEQEAFTGMAQSLEQKLASSQIYSLFKGTGAQGAAQLQDMGTLLLEQAQKETIFNIFDQPFPTLASLAASIELFFQGTLYKGFFTSFNVDESADSPGLFTYDLAFTAYSRQGTRRNFMPWHREPFNPADVNANPLSFNGALQPITVLTNLGSAPIEVTTPPVRDFKVDNNLTFSSSPNKVVRDIKFATFAGGKSVSELDFLKNPPRITR